VESKGLRGFPLNYQERRIYHWHEELDRRIGKSDVAERLQVPERLADWVTDESPAPVPAEPAET
jgi:hypothetical protein